MTTQFLNLLDKIAILDCINQLLFDVSNKSEFADIKNTWFNFEVDHEDEKSTYWYMNSYLNIMQGLASNFAHIGFTYTKINKETDEKENGDDFFSIEEIMKIIQTNNYWRT